MPWFAWLYVVLMGGCIGVVGWCAWDVGRIAKQIRRGV